MMIEPVRLMVAQGTVHGTVTHRATGRGGGHGRASGDSFMHFTQLCPRTQSCRRAVRRKDFQRQRNRGDANIAMQ
eukprot:5087942-Prymnesium_polylepis.1